ncbi:MAG: hypothetical protein K2N22_01095 [Clostridia bacterium]|nr:hypothetical protein [Clostridia bacterium]
MNIEIDASPSFYFMPQPYKPVIDIPQTKPRANARTVNANNPVYEQRPVRKPVERKYVEHRPRVPKEVKNEIAVTEVESQVRPVQHVYTEEKVVEPVVEGKEEIKLEIPVTEHISVEVSPEYVAPKAVEASVPKNSEAVASKKPERVESFEEKPLEEKRFRIAVARRKLNF